MASTGSFFNVLKKHTTMSESKIKQETEKVLPSTITTKVLTTAREAISDKSEGKHHLVIIVKSVRQEIKDKSPEFNFAGFSTDINGLIPGVKSFRRKCSCKWFSKVKRNI